MSTKLRTMPWSKELHFFIQAKETRSYHCLKTHLCQSRTTHLTTTVSITIDCLSSNSAWDSILYIVYSLTVPGQTTTPTKATTSIMGGCKTLAPHILGGYSDSEETVDTQVPEEPTEHTHAPGVMPEWWNSTSPLSSPPSLLCSPTPSPPPTAVRTRGSRSRTPAPTRNSKPRKCLYVPKKKDHFEHPPEDTTSSFYWPEDAEGDTEADTGNDTEEDTEDAKDDSEGLSSPAPSASSELADQNPESPPTSPIVKTPTPKKDKKGKKDKASPVKSKPAHKTTVGGRVKKNKTPLVKCKATYKTPRQLRREKANTIEKVQCNGRTKKNAQCGHQKTVPKGETWNCGRHK